MSAEPAEPLEAPSWVTSWYANDPMGQALAVRRYNTPVTTAAERRAAQQYVPTASTYGCTSCGQFAFAQPRLCYWCITRGTDR